jgi:Kelch motif/Galactose oxidase, central domain
LLLVVLVRPTTVVSARCDCDDKASFDWRKVVNVQNNTGPTNFLQSGNAAIGNKVYVFGGNHQLGSTFYDDFYSFDMLTNRWIALSNKGPGPHGEQPISFVWGTDTFQFDSEYKALGDFWIYSVASDAWEQVIAQHPNPGPQTRATLFVDDEANKVYLFGGFVDFSTEPPNDIWEFDFAMKQWLQLIADTRPNGLLPLGRNIASGGPIIARTHGGTKKLVIYGGEGFNLTNFKFPILDDLWEFDLASRSWKDIPAPSDVETPKRN